MSQKILIWDFRFEKYSFNERIILYERYEIMKLPSWMLNKTTEHELENSLHCSIYNWQNKIVIFISKLIEFYLVKAINLASAVVWSGRQSIKGHKSVADWWLTTKMALEVSFCEYSNLQLYK